MLFFDRFFGLKGPTGPISTTAGGGLGVQFQDMTLGFHLEPFATYWVHSSQSKGPKSDRDHKKVENFFQAMTFGNSAF
jgi:hypothetical protein